MFYDTRFAVGPGSMEIPEISVLCANKNHGRFIEQNILSVLFQSGITYEHIVVDGASTDGSLEIIGKYPHVVCTIAPELNVGDAFLEAARMARGKYIMVTTSTDGYLGNWFRKAADVLEADPEVSLVWGNMQHMSEDGLLQNLYWPEHFASPPPQKFDTFLKFIETKRHAYLPELNYCVRKDVFMECCFSNDADGPFSEMKDINWLFRLLFKFHQRGYLPYYVSAVANFARTHKGQFTEQVTASGEQDRDLALYAQAVERYREMLWSGQPHHFRNGKRELIGRFIWPALVFDIGANVGAKAADLSAHNVRVVCFEPAPDYFNHLQARFDGSSLVTVDRAALGAAPAVASLLVKSTVEISLLYEGSPESRFRGYTWDRALDVKVRTLDSAIDQYGLPDYCTIDTGFEPQALKGLSRQIPVISFAMSKDRALNAIDSVKLLVGLDYHLFNIAYGDSTVFRHRDWIQSQILLTELLSNVERSSCGRIFASLSATISSRVLPLMPSTPSGDNEPHHDASPIDTARWKGLVHDGEPTSLRLRCGERHGTWYITCEPALCAN